MQFPTFPVIRPSQGIILTFDFSQNLPIGITLQGTPTVTATVDFGQDDNPSNIISSSLLNGSQIFVAIAGCQPDTDYLISVSCGTTSPSINRQLSRILPVRR